MAERTFTYRVVVDARDAGQAAAQARAAIERELNQVRFAPTVAAGSAARTAPASPLQGGPSFSDFSNALSKVAGLSIGGFAVTQMARASLEAGRLGAENLRLARSYEQLAQGAGLAADTLLQRLSVATQQTVTEQNLMASTNLMLAAAQEGQIAVSERQIETLARFARLRSTQLTANGNPLSTEEAYGRLISGIVKRETELLDELGISTKALADQLGVPIQEVNKDVESLLGAITKVAEVEIARFGDPVLDEATRIEQAATRIEEARNRINAALAGPSAYAHEAAAFIVEQMTFSGRNPYRDAMLVDRQRTASMFAERGQSALMGAQEFARMAELLRGTQAALDAGKAGADALDDAVMKLAADMAQSAFVTEEQRNQLAELEVQLRVTASEGIVYAEGLDEADEAARRLAESQAALNAQFAEAQRLLRVSYNGQMFVNLPQTGLQPVQGPGLPSDDYMNFRVGLQTGRPTSLLGADLIQTAREQQQQLAEEQRRQAEREAQAAIRENERVARQAQSAFERAADATRRAFRDAASELEHQLRSIPGLFGRSDVTQEQMQLAEWGLAQNFADDIRRRLMDEVMNGVDWEDIDPAALFARAGIDPNLDPRAQMAIFNERWADSSLFADPDNLELLNASAIREAMHRQEMSRLGRRNILAMFGLGEDEEGAYFTGLGTIMRDGMMAGAEEGLSEFSRNAIAGVMMRLKDDAAVAQYMDVGRTMSAAMMQGFVDGTLGSDIVNAISARVLEELADIFPRG